MRQYDEGEIDGATSFDMHRISCYLSKGMEVIYSISVPLFDYDYSTIFSTVKARVLKIRERSVKLHCIFC